MKDLVCNICGKTKPDTQLMPAALVRNSIADQQVQIDLLSELTHQRVKGRIS